MSFLKKVLDRMTGSGKEDNKEEAPKRKMTEEEILRAIDELAAEEKAKEEKEAAEEKTSTVLGVGLWSTFKYLSSVGHDDFGNPKLFFVIPFSIDKDNGESVVEYICFPLNGSYLDISERTIRV
jgi:hypothetical protein